MPNSFTKPVSANDILSALGGIAVDLGTSSGSANALAGASTVDTGTTFTSGRLYRIRANAANTGAATCSINGGTGVALKKPPSSTALASGDIANATELLLFFDGTNLQVLSGLTVMPTQNELEANASSQTLNSNNFTTIAYDTPGTNTGPAWSYSGGIWTCLIAGKYDIDAIIYASSNVAVELYINKNGTRRYGGSAVICISAPYVHRTISFAIGDTMYVESYAAGTGPTLDVSIAGLREIAINRRA